MEQIFTWEEGVEFPNELEMEGGKISQWHRVFISDNEASGDTKALFCLAKLPALTAEHDRSCWVKQESGSSQGCAGEECAAIQVRKDWLRGSEKKRKKHSWEMVYF